MLYARATRWLSVQNLERRVALTALLITLPSLAIGLVADDYVLANRVKEGGPFAAYVFVPLEAEAATAQRLEDRFEAA